MKYRAYLIGLSVTVLVGALPFFAFYWFLLASNEHYSVSRVVAAQSVGGGLYGTALHNSEHAFKMEILAKAHPQVIALGSSRVLQMRGEFFDVPFANLGRTLLSVSTAEKTFREILKIHRPKLIIIGIDYWWFSGDYAAPDRGLMDRGGWMAPTDSLMVLRWIRAGKLTASRFFEVLSRRQKNMGSLAVLNKDGFDRFGARVRTSLATGKTPAVDKGFRLSLAAMKTGRGNFPHANRFDEKSWESFVAALRVLADNKIDVVAVLPPIAGAVLQKMEATRGLQYLTTLRTRLPSLPVRTYDFTDAGSIGSPDCEFYDAVHGGAVTYARMLRAMAATNPEMADTVNMSVIDRTIETSIGRASSRTLDRIETEIDFLGLSCVKSPQTAAQKRNDYRESK